MTGTIVKGIGGFYYVDTERGIVQCRARGKMRREKILPLIGDNVTITIASESPLEGAIDEILPRKNSLIRPPVSNIDVVVIVIATASPAPDFFVIDKLIASAEKVETDIVIAVNKTDLSAADDIIKAYKPAGYTVIPLSAANGSGIDSLKRAISGRTAAFAGNSGVGKSSILNYFGFELETGEVSKIERGRHTTRHVELMAGENGGFVIDTPGFSLLELTSVTAEDLDCLFAEFEQYKNQCSFKNCRHFNVSKTECAVVKAVMDGNIPQSRYDSYCQLYDKLKDVRAWDL